MLDEDKNFGGSLVLEFRKWWRHLKTIYRVLVLKIYFLRFGKQNRTHLP